MDKFATICIGLGCGLLMFVAGWIVGSKHEHNKEVPVHSNQLTMEFALGERVIVMDYTVGGKRELVQGVVTGWGLTDFDLTGKEEVHYFVSTNSDHSAHGYKAADVTRIAK